MEVVLLRQLRDAQVTALLRLDCKQHCELSRSVLETAVVSYLVAGGDDDDV